MERRVITSSLSPFEFPSVFSSVFKLELDTFTALHGAWHRAATGYLEKACLILGRSMYSHSRVLAFLLLPIKLWAAEHIFRD
jgi:hypothetical protein